MELSESPFDYKLRMHISASRSGVVEQQPHAAAAQKWPIASECHGQTYVQEPHAEFETPHHRI